MYLSPGLEWQVQLRPFVVSLSLGGHGFLTEVFSLQVPHYPIPTQGKHLKKRTGTERKGKSGINCLLLWLSSDPQQSANPLPADMPASQSLQEGLREREKLLTREFKLKSSMTASFAPMPNDGHEVIYSSLQAFNCL